MLHASDDSPGENNAKQEPTMIFTTNSKLLMPNKKHNPNKARSKESFGIPEKFPSRLTLVLRWTLLSVEKENYDQIDDYFNEKTYDTVNQHNDLMEEVPDDESSELNILNDGGDTVCFRVPVVLMEKGFRFGIIPSAECF